MDGIKHAEHGTDDSQREDEMVGEQDTMAVVTAR